MSISCPNKRLKVWKDLVQNVGENKAYVLWAEHDGNVPDNYYQNKIQSKEINFQKNQTVSNEGIVASEQTIRDLAARMSDRIGIPFKIESDRTKEYKGKIENGVAYINLAYATLDTAVHEILGHPIIRAIKDGVGDKTVGWYKDGVFQPHKYNNPLYQNLLKELETGRGKEVLDRIKRDYVNKNTSVLQIVEKYGDVDGVFKGGYNIYNPNTDKTLATLFNTKEEAQKEIDKATPKYSLEEQQEEAIVELLGLMTANKLDNVKDGKLISLLKRLLKEMKQFIRSLINQKEIEIDKLPDNMTLGDLSDLLAYSNSKLILPGFEVEYTTTDNMKFKTYQEASNHISELAKNTEDVNLDTIKINNQSVIGKTDPITGKIIKNANFRSGSSSYFSADDNQYEPSEPSVFELQFEDGSFNQVYKDELNNKEIKEFYNLIEFPNKTVNNFIERNKEYEQSKEIIEEWKKVNNIQYNPEEIYSRGQEFSSVVGAYSDFDVNLMMQNLLSHIEDNEKAGGKFAISAYTKPSDKSIRHLDGGGGKIKFNINPQSEDILWAANTDVYSGSVWDASEKVNKDKKSELLGVSYTKYPSLRSINTVQPNLANIVDDLAHHHNELGIVLTGSNFRLEYDEDIPYTTKKIIDSINKILDQKYGKLVKPESQSNQELSLFESFKQIEDKLPNLIDTRYVKYKKENDKWYRLTSTEEYNNKPFVEMNLSPESSYSLNEILAVAKDKLNIIPEKYKNKVVQPAQTNETLKESIESIKNSKNIDKNKDQRIIYLKERLEDLNNVKILKSNKNKDPYKEYDRVVFLDEVMLYEQKGKFFFVDLTEQYAEPTLISKKQFEEDLLKYGDSKKIKIEDDFYLNVPDKIFSFYERFNTKEQAENFVKNEKETVNKELKSLEINETKDYNSQALINTKIAAIKEVAKAQPRSLIRSEVKPVNNNTYITSPLFEDEDALPFQKIPSVDFSSIIDDSVETIFPDIKSEPIKQSEDNQNHELLFKDKETKTISATEVLNSLIENDVFKESKEEDFFIEKMKILLNKSGAKLKLITDKNSEIYKKFDNKTVMVYDSVDNTIYVSDVSLENFSKETLAEAFIHEVVHSTTLRAYFAPRTFEERQFREFIDKSYAQYKFLSETRDKDGNLMYGFTNQAEFIAEIFSNPKFRKEIETIEKNWLNKFVDAVRRLFEMAKNGFNTDLIKSAILFQVVDEFAGRNSSNWKGTLMKDPRFEKFGSTEFSKKIEPEKVRNLQDRLDNLIKIQKDNVIGIMKRANANHKKHGAKNQDFINNLKKLDNLLNDAAQTDKLKAINTYVDFMVNQINSIERLLKSSNNNETLEVIERYKTYLGASDLLKPVTDTLTDKDFQDLSEEQQAYANEILDKLAQIGGHYNILQSKFTAHVNKELIDELKKSYFTEKVVQDFRNKLAKEYPANSPMSKKEWVNSEMLKRKDELDLLIEEDTTQLIKGVSSDIDGADANIFDVLNTKSRLIQVVWKIITKMQSKINDYIRDNDFKLDALYQNLIKEKGSYKLNNLLEKDQDGQYFIKGEYSLKFRDKYQNEYSKYLDELLVLRKELTAQGVSDIKKESNPRIQELYKKLSKWRLENTKTVKGELLPSDIYKNTLNFSKAEKAIYDEYLDLAEKGVVQFGKNNSLVKISLNARYYSLPYNTITNLERLKENKVNAKEFLKQKVSDIIDWKVDDIENNEKMFTPGGVRIRNIPILYRNVMSKSKDEKEFKKRIAEQSTDILTLMRLEHSNLVNYSEKSKKETILNALVDTSKEKLYNRTDSNGNFVTNVFGWNKKTVTLQGSESNTAKRLESIINQSLYNEFNEEGIKIAGKDINKLVKSVNKHTAFLGMSLNYFSAPVNIANAEFQTFLLKIAGEIKGSAMSSAHKFYFADMGNILNDTGRPVNHSVTNQLNEIFDVFGGLTSKQQDFVKNSMFKAIASPQLLQILQEGGEHMVQSILNIALLKSIKVTNSEGKFIDKEGNVTTEDKGAFIFDMVNQDKNTKQVSFSDKFTYTDLSTNTKWNEGGFENVKLYIKKKISDTMGQHDKNYQSEYQRHWWGQLLSMFKKHVVPLGITRYRGAGKMFVNSFDLSEEDKHWNEFLQVNEEGFYTTFGRLVLGGFNKGIVNGLQNLKWTILSSKWNEMSDYEKSNVKKAVTELASLALLNMIIIPLIMGVAGDSDDDNLIYLAMLARRLEQELSFYTDVNDAYKVTRNPVASLNLIEDVLSVAKFTLTPTAWFSETKKGDLRVLNALEKITVPVRLRESSTSENALKQMNRNLIRPYNESMFYRLMNE